SSLLREIGPQAVPVCRVDAKRKVVRPGTSEALLPACGQSLIPIVCCQERNHTSDGSLNKQIIIGRLDIVQPHENVAIRTTNWLTSRPSSGAFLFPPSLPTRQCRGTSRTTRWCCAAMYGLGLRKSALSTIGFVSSIDSVETPRPRNRSSV